MDRQEDRLSTFSHPNWPSDCPVKPEDLAAAGQVYHGPGDKTECYICGGTLHNWLEGDDPYEEHKRHFPDCRLSQEPKIPYKKQRLGRRKDAADKAETGIDLAGGGPSWRSGREERKYLDMSELRDREETFKEWTGKGNLWSQNMALAGFYHIGPEDRVKCFKCQIGLDDWKDSDIVIQEHRDHSPSCPFVKQIAKQLKDKPPVHQLPKKTDDPIYLPHEPGPPSEEMLPLPASMEQDQRCILCKQRDREVLFEPCDHYVVCEECSKGLSQCPKCKTPILRKTLYGRRHALP